MKYLRYFVPGLFLLAIMLASPLTAQKMAREEMIFLTQDWEGERFPDGRPKVADDILKRMKNISIEEAWGFMRGRGFHNQFEGNWEMIHDDVPIVGRALTAQYMPNRPDMKERIEKRGLDDGNIGAMNSWPIDALTTGDVYVADAFGKVIDGTLIGDNLGNAIYANSGNGVVFDGGSRDLAGLAKIDGFNAFVRGFDPSFLQEVMLTGINVPIRIGRATVLPGDIVLAKREGVIFIPAYLAREVVINGEFVALRDEFGITRLKEGTYTPGQIDGRWADEIKKDFLSWLDANPDKLPMSRAELDEYLKNRTW